MNIQSTLENVDFARLAEVYARAFNGEQSAERIEIIFRRAYAFRIAFVDEELVGAVYAFSDGELDASIHGLAVHPDFQKRGIGSALMTSLLEEFPEHMALLLTAEQQHQPIYRKFGFRPLKTAMARGFADKDMEE